MNGLTARQAANSLLPMVLKELGPYWTIIPNFDTQTLDLTDGRRNEPWLTAQLQECGNIDHDKLRARLREIKRSIPDPIKPEEDDNG